MVEYDAVGRRIVEWDGREMTTPLRLEHIVLNSFDLPPGRVWNMDGLRDDVCWNSEAAHIVWRHVAAARAQAGDEAVDFLLRVLSERIADDLTGDPDPITVMCLTLA